MIHSLCGGILKDNGFYTVIKVKFINNPLSLPRPYWFICEIFDVVEGDKVLAPFNEGNNLYEATVIRVDKMVNEQTLPMPLSRMGVVTKRA